MRVRLIIPMTFTDPRFDNRIDACPDCFLGDIARIAGGYTSYDGRGGWINAEEELVEEPIRIVDIDLDNGNDCTNGALERVRTIARRIAGAYFQECVYLSVDGIVEYVKP